MSAEHDEEAEWIERVRGGDSAAFGRILERYRAPLFDFCWRMLRDAGAAEDVAQETFARAYHHLGDFRPGRARLSTWLFLIARRQCLDLLRKRARQATDVHPDPDATTTRTSFDEAADRELGAAIGRAVAELPEDQRAAIVLAEYEGRSVVEIAGIMESSPKSVESRLYRARQFLRRRLAAWMDDPGISHRS